MEATDARPGDPFAGGGEMRARCRAMDWGSTSLGPVESWSPTLRDTVRTCMESPFAINLWCGPELVLIYNDGYRYVLGAKHPEALGKPGPVVWAEIWGEIEPMFAQIRAGGPPVYADDAPFHVFRDGEPESGAVDGEPNAWFTFALSAVRDDEGEIVAFLNIVSETTRRLQAEQAAEQARAEAERAEARLREVFTQAPTFLAVLRGPEHVFEYVNEAYYQLVGHRDLVGLPVAEALPEIREQGFKDLLDGVFETGEPFVGREVSVLLARGSGAEPEERFVDFVYYPITEADGTISGVVAHGSDVTEHVLARRAAQRARADAEEANRAKSIFLANMSHELRTPINAIVGYAELTEMGIAGPLTPEQRTNLERIRSSSRHLLGLVNEVLDLAKVESDQMEVEHERAPVARAAREALDLVGPQASKRDVEIRDRIGSETREEYVGDADRVRQILVNLLSNAVKFTQPGGWVELSCGIDDQPDANTQLSGVGPWLRVDVEDSGAGIPFEQLGQIFEPFFQVNGGFTRESGGTGLGLTISRRLARAMGGDLTVRSRLGEGSCFTLWLPAAEAGVLGEVENRRVWPREAHTIPHLGEVGRTLADCAEKIVEQQIKRLREDAAIPSTAGLDRAQLEDHAPTFLVDIGLALQTLDEGGGEPALMHDGTEIQRVISELHGAQRARLGWREEELRREFDLLREVVDATVREEVPEEARGSVDEALAIVRRLLDQAERVSSRGYHRAVEQRRGA